MTYLEGRKPGGGFIKVVVTVFFFNFFLFSVEICERQTIDEGLVRNDQASTQGSDPGSSIGM